MTRPYNSKQNREGTRIEAKDNGACDSNAVDRADPRVFGLVKAAYTVKETIDVLSIGRTSLYAAIKRGDLKPVKFGKKTLFFAVDLAFFLTSLRGVTSKTKAPSWPPRK
jgi:hypothetical protein